MQDIRKPYTRSKSNQDTLSGKFEAFESRTESQITYTDTGEDENPVQIPVRRARRNVNDMDMYPKKRKYENIAYSELEREHALPPQQEDIVYRDPRTKYKKSRNHFGTLAFIIVVLFLSIGAGLMTYVFNSATVTVTPKHVDIDDFKNTITFSQLPINDIATSSVSYVVATSSVTKKKTLSSSETKKVETKASGKIIVYNNFDSNPQKLIKSTRFESSNGKIFRINQSITIPGKKGNTPGSVAVTIYADTYGSDYNSEATDFTIPGFKGTPRYKGFFAKSDGPITGGASGDVSLVSLSDLNAAIDGLALELQPEIKAELSKNKKDGYTGLYSAIEINYTDNRQDVMQGITSTYEVTATGYLMQANTKELAEAIARDVRDYANEPVDLDYADTLNFTLKDTDNIASTTPIKALVEGKPRIIWTTDEDSIKTKVAGKKRDEFKTVMKSISSIEGAEISFSPLWLSSFPQETSKILVVESLPKR